MNLVSNLRDSLNKQPTVVGKVVASNDGVLKVQTSEGLVTVKNSGVTEIRAGDDVKLLNGVLVGRLNRSASVPVFYL